MSLNSAAASLGSAIGAMVGGFALLSFDYEGLGALLGTMGIVAGIVYLLLTHDFVHRENESLGNGSLMH